MTESNPFVAALKYLRDDIAVLRVLCPDGDPEIDDCESACRLLEAAGELTENDKKWLLSKVDWAIAEYVPAIEGMVCPGAAMKDRFRALLLALPLPGAPKKEE